MESKNWNYEVEIDGAVNKVGTIKVCQDYNTISATLAGVYRVNTWNVLGTKKDANGKIIAMRMRARHERSIVTATATIA